MARPLEVFNLTRVRVSVTKEKLEQIADILGVPQADRDRILQDGIVITTPTPAADSTA
jgi:hypothetical protein